uniref:Lrp/AsnC family transcriptional regulator n=1 Tax=Gongylonema pulchrum TaxID=637853 RepID=A0A183E1K5_9BILA
LDSITKNPEDVTHTAYTKILTITSPKDFAKIEEAYDIIANMTNQCIEVVIATITQSLHMADCFYVSLKKHQLIKQLRVVNSYTNIGDEQIFFRTTDS